MTTLLIVGLTIFNMVIFGLIVSMDKKGNNRPLKWYDHQVHYTTDISGFEAMRESIEEFLVRRIQSGVGKVELT